MSDAASLAILNKQVGAVTSTSNGSRVVGIRAAEAAGFDIGSKSYISTPAAEEVILPDNTAIDMPTEPVYTAPASSAWLRENTIVSNSQPWIKVTFNPFTKNIKDMAVAQRTEIIAAEFDCPTNMNTEGTITIIDPEGVWPSRLTRVGALVNSITDAGKPNIKVEFGWIGLDHGPGDRGNSKIRYITGMVLDVGFDISDTGVTTAKINFVQTPYVSLDLVRLVDPDDIQAIHQWSKEDNEWKTGPTSYRLNKLCAWDSGLQIGYELEKLKLRLIFADTGDSQQQYNSQFGIGSTGTNNSFNIRFGDKLDTIINSATAKAKYLEKYNTKKVSYIYGRMAPPIFSGSSGSSTPPEQTLVYKWTAVPVSTNPTPDKDSFPELTSDGKPLLAWKFAIDPLKGKQLIEWTSDLSSFYKILLQAQDAFDEKLGQFTDKDWNIVTDAMEDAGADFVDDKVWYEFLMTSRAKDARTAMKEEFDETVKQYNKEVQGEAGSQLAAAVAQNVFKGNAKIMGDPTIGTDYEAWRTKFKMDFDAVGKFASLFSRDWVMTKAKHVFGEGSYTTEMEMLCYPIGKDSIPESDEFVLSNTEFGE